MNDADAQKMLIDLIIAQGHDDKSRAHALGVSIRTITDYKAGRVPRVVKTLLEKGILVVNTSKGAN
ncbi:MAG: hypothetical protein EOM24_00790 [Chloroflexia bacterium]|nr:hypothetical protein [Chloroflexia bacterium]